MTIWLDPEPVLVPDSLSSAVGGHPIVARILAQRGLDDLRSARAFLDPSQYTPASPFDLPGMDRAVERIHQAITRGQRIAVWGDFDVDGQTATTVLVSTLRALSAEVIFHIPVRAAEGHGVNLVWLQRLIDEDASLVLTCDTGITAHEAVDYARLRGVDVVITDHHDLAPTLPAAYAVVNPKLLPEGHPLGTVPGVGVAYKLAEALVASSAPGIADQQVDLVALGIVADVALQTGDTRFLLQRGLTVLRDARRLGLQVMLQLAGVNPAWLTEEHIGFELGPRLNALGRLGDANLAVEFLTTSDPERARILATQLEGYNIERKRLTTLVLQGALAQIEREPALLDHAVLVLSHPMWHPGVIGIVASRLVERFHRPVVLIAAPPGELARGSARSVAGCNITAAIAAHAEMLAGFGGHPMAAGLSLDAERIPEFRRKLANSVRDQVGEIATEPALQIDGILPLADLTLELVADIERLAPFGPGNPSPVLVDRDLSLKSTALIGRTREHLQALVEDAAGSPRRVFWWQGAGWPLPEGRFDLAYTVRASTYRGQRDVQVEWVDARPLAESAAEGEQSKPVVVDHRHQPEPVAILAQMRNEIDIQLWCEGEARRKLDGRDRTELESGETLVVWTTPAGRAELEDVLQRVQPKTVVLFAVDPGLDRPDAFLARLAGLVKRALGANDGQINLRMLAAATAQREATVRVGLRWLAARGHVRIAAEEGDEVRIESGDGALRVETGALMTQLQSLLEETAAYRQYFEQAEPDALT
jgi:single-stranded-DNA-specific exonuclease